MRKAVDGIRSFSQTRSSKNDEEKKKIEVV